MPRHENALPLLPAAGNGEISKIPSTVLFRYMYFTPRSYALFSRFISNEDNSKTRRRGASRTSGRWWDALLASPLLASPCLVSPSSNKPAVDDCTEPPPRLHRTAQIYLFQRSSTVQRKQRIHCVILHANLSGRDTKPSKKPHIHKYTHTYIHVFPLTRTKPHTNTSYKEK